MVKVRFAPSPTGIPHVGNIRTALFDYFFARSKKGTFILRIEDTDQARKTEGAVEKIEESLKWLGASWDEKVIQSERLAEYKNHAQDLLKKGLALEDAGAIRFIIPHVGSTSWVDLVGNKTIEFKNAEIEDFIILKKDGFPTYHLANVIDDHLMEITHVIRGEDWIPSTPKHLMLYEAFGWVPPEFAHVPNVMGTDGKKLSKRKGAKSALDYKSEGVLPEALCNYLMLLGWSPKNNREILTTEEIESEFDFNNVNVAPAVFDERKLLWMNGEYVRGLSLEELKNKLIEFDPEISSIQNFEKYLLPAQTRMKTLLDFKELVENNDSVEYSEEQKKLAQVLLEKLGQLTEWKAEKIADLCLETRDQLKLKTKDIFIVLSGKPQGIPFQEKLVIQGKEETTKFLKSHV